MNFYLCHGSVDMRKGIVSLSELVRRTMNASPENGDVFIFLDTVHSNALEFHTTYEDELHRVVVHSVLHLMGFKDKSNVDAREMRQNENHCLELLKTI